jgi:cell division transport system permease protein
MISNTIKLAMYDRRDEIGIMKMVGATNRFIRFPYFVEGFLIGVIAGALAFFITWGIYDLIAREIHRVDALQMFDIVPFTTLLIPMVVTFGAAGLFVGIFGSVMSIRKFLDV